MSSQEITALIERICFLLRASVDPQVPAQLEMGGLAEAVLTVLAAETKRTGAIVTTPATWPKVTGVGPWLQVIWWNLIDNALRHGPAGAEIRLTWKRVEGGYFFSVIDQGTGIAPEIQAGFFRPFDQLHTVRLPGLGLSIVQRLVALQGGSSHFARRNDGKSEFSFTLPTGNPGR